jgi:hypothetical protein
MQALSSTLARRTSESRFLFVYAFKRDCLISDIHINRLERSHARFMTLVPPDIIPPFRNHAAIVGSCSLYWLRYITIRNLSLSLSTISFSLAINSGMSQPTATNRPASQSLFWLPRKAKVSPTRSGLSMRRSATYQHKSAADTCPTLGAYLMA